MAFNNPGVYLNSVPGGANTGGFGLRATSMRLNTVLDGPYFMGGFFLDTGVDAPAWTTIADASNVYIGKAWATGGTSFGQNLTSGQLAGDVYITAVPTFEQSLNYLVSSGLPSYRVFLKCEAWVRNVKAYVQADGVACFLRLDSIAWALIKA